VNSLFKEKIVETPNLVVNLGVQALPLLLGGGYGAPALSGIGLSLPTLSGASVGSMVLGNQPIPAAVDPTDVTPIALGYIASVNPANPLAHDAIFSTASAALAVSYPTPYSVRFTAVVPPGACNASDHAAITEEMLLTVVGTVFARVAFGTSLSLTTNAVTSAGGTVLNFASGGTGAIAGMAVFGVGVDAGTHVISSTATSVTMSQPTTAGVGSGVAITFSNGLNTTAGTGLTFSHDITFARA
jgi:hypothetical protein